VSLLGRRLLAVHDALSGGGVPHAFGGAIALAYCTEEPRGTRDLDVNVFVAPAGAGPVLAALPAGVAVTDTDRRGIERNGQARVWWDDTPIYLFFDVHDFHRQVGAGVRLVSFLERRVPVLACTDLVVFKAMFNRTKDWADIEEMVLAGTVDSDRALAWLARLLGPSDTATLRLAALVGDAGIDR
jgi:GNAT superfamily N-acetyltransferase